MFLLFVACIPRLYTDGPSETDTADVPWTAPENTWRQSAPPEDLQTEGWGNGAVAPDFRLVDQHGDVVSLWQFHGSLVLVDVSTMWCAPCRDLAEGTEATQQAFAEDLVYVTALAEDVESHPPDGADLTTWADYYGIASAPVVSDGDKALASELVPDAVYPVLVLVGRDLRVIERVTPATDEAVHEAIEAHLE